MLHLIANTRNREGRNMDVRLDGRVAVVTGAGSGIGEGIARGLAASGADIAILDIREDAAKHVAAGIAEEYSVKAEGIAADVTSEQGVDAAVSTVVETLGGLDILVNNAGIAVSGDIHDYPLDAWNKTLAINLTGYFLMGRAAARHMIAKGIEGAIINISSKSGVRGSAEHSAYNATKFGEVGLTQGWARELAKNKIRVNAILPGNVLKGSGIWNDEYKAGMAAKLGIDPSEVEDYYNKQVPLGRSCDVEDIANMVVFLASDKASYITGCMHLVDGGQEMR
jgi:sorbitol-6-phosphate 2-dehydrogenase